MSDHVIRIPSGNRPTAFADLALPAASHVLVLAPHPDDFDVVAVTLRFLQRNGNRLVVAVLTSGASGVQDGFGGAITAEEKGAIREREQRASCRFFGLPDEQLRFLKLTEDAAGELARSDANRKHLLALFAACEPDLVFLPHHNDPNPDHRRTYEMFREIMRHTSAPVTAFLNRDPKTASMRTDVYMGFDETTAAWKAELLRFHQSQHQRNLDTRGYGIDERILNMNRGCASECGGACSYAETFEMETHGSAA